MYISLFSNTYTRNSFIIHEWILRCLSSLHILVNVNNGTINTRIQKYLLGNNFIPFGYVPESGMVGLHTSPGLMS